MLTCPSSWTRLGIHRGRRLGIHRGRRLGVHRGRRFGVHRGRQLSSGRLAIASEQLKNAVLHDGYHDATLGLTPPDFATIGAQTGSAPTEVLLAVLGAHQTDTL